MPGDSGILVDDCHETTAVEIGTQRLRGLLGIPAEGLDAQPSAIVIFAHGSGSGRFSPRNNYVAGRLRRAGIATLLLDLLTPQEESDRRNVFDVGLLARRLAFANDWVGDDARTRDMSVGYFGASTGAAAALIAAALPESNVRALVSRGGRPDLALPSLADVRAPTLLLVGELDEAVLAMNRAALNRLSTEKELVIVPGAGHLFEEPGTLDEVVTHAIRWFRQHLLTAPDGQQTAT
jgi:putative phosphoribosyl transferase